MSTVIFCTLLIMTLLPSFSWNSMVSWTKSTPSPDNCQSQSPVDPARDTSKQHRETIRKQDLHQALFYYTPRECFLLSWKDALNSDENLNTSILQPNRTRLFTRFSICATWAVGNLNIVPVESTEPHSKLMLFMEIPSLHKFTLGTYLGSQQLDELFNLLITIICFPISLSMLLLSLPQCCWQLFTLWCKLIAAWTAPWETSEF